MITTNKFPIITLKGSPRELGYEHGSRCKDLIHRNIDLYSNLFNIQEKTLFRLADHYKNKISQFNKKYCMEIEAIAEGAEVDPRWIYALNARTEIINRLMDECTSVYFRNSAILGQNWDWVQESEELAIILRIEKPDGQKILTLTEPGIISKIGFNNQGLGVCLNYLHIEKESNGVPVHILLRRILECRTIEEAVSVTDLENIGTASNILIADNGGNYLDLEMAIDKLFFHKNKTNIFIHTNHFLVEGFDENAEDFAGSLSRYEKASKIAKQLSGVSIDEMKLILLDGINLDDELPICRRFEGVENFGNLGTVTTVIMNLKKLEMEITKGNPFENDFITIKI